MKESYYYIVTTSKEDLDKIWNQILEDSREKFFSSGYEEYSLNEEEVDKILGEEAFCGGDLTEDLMEKLESEAQKKFQFYFTGENSKKNSHDFLTYLENLGAKECKVSENREEDWNENWKKHYKPIELDSIIVVPVWETDIVPDTKDKKKVIINPGMGFGTGTHETTRQCLLILQDFVKKDFGFENCLDFGAGSGILGIAFQKYFGKPTDYVDIDLAALENNKENSKLNFKEKLPPSNYFLRSDFNLKDKYSLVFANILEHVLLLEKDLLINALDDNGILIVSGILKEQRESIVENFGDALKVVNERNEGDWLAISFERK